MMEMLTAKDMQKLLQVDRSTIYRMAEAGRLPAIKVGKQWRFPDNQVQDWLETQTPAQPTPQPTTGNATQSDIATLLPLECVQLIQDSHSELLGVMLVVTDLDGNPVTQPSNPCGLFAAISKEPDAVQKCISSWHDLGHSLNIEPAFHKSHLGLLCVRLVQ